METGQQLNVSSDKTGEKQEVEPANPSLQGEWFIHYNTAAAFWVLIQPKPLFSWRGKKDNAA